MLEAFLEFNKKETLFKKSDKILVGVSGGRDSMVLLHLLKHADIEISTAHVNYHLRGESSNLDEKLVTEICDEWQIPLYTKHVQLTADANTQIEARRARYSFFDELKKKHDFQWIATAHHQDDRLETMFINILRGTGIYGMAGIPIKTDNIIRPLLFASRQEITAFAQSKNIPFRDDLSNEGDAYLRNRIRHHLIPSISELNENAIQRTLQSSNLLAQDALAISAMVDLIVEQKGDIYLVHLKQLPEKAGAIWLYHCLRPFGFNRNQASDLFHSNESGKRSINREYAATRRSDETIQVEPILTQEWLPANIPGKGTYVFGALQIDVTQIKVGPNEHPHSLIAKTTNPIYLDEDKVRWPLRFLPLKGSETMQPLGSTSMVKVKKLLDTKPTEANTDSLFSLKNRGYAALGIKDGMDEILWLHNRRISALAAVTENTQNILIIKTWQ